MSTTREITKQGRDGTSVRLLPLSKDPFQSPTDRDMLPSERREFVRTHRTCVFGYGRQSDGPAMSIVYYIPADNDDLYVATMADRAKAKAVARNGKVSLCVLDEAWLRELGFDVVTLERSGAVEFFEAKLQAKGTHP